MCIRKIISYYYYENDIMSLGTVTGKTGDNIMYRLCVFFVLLFANGSALVKRLSVLISIINNIIIYYYST